MRIKHRLERLEETMPSPARTGPSLADEIDRRTAEYEAADAAHRAEVAAALAGDDPERRAWAVMESERLVALQTMSTGEWLASEWPRLKAEMLAGRVPHP
jgi:hypothetical protein